ncbi:MAG: hypothetical protein R2867_35995 [Caldilineaceae bacterium]
MNFLPIHLFTRLATEQTKILSVVAIKSEEVLTCGRFEHAPWHLPKPIRNCEFFNRVEDSIEEMTGDDLRQWTNDLLPFDPMLSPPIDQVAINANDGRIYRAIA